MLQSMPLK